MIEIEPQIFWPLILSLFFNTVIQSKSNLKPRLEQQLKIANANQWQEN